MPNHTMNRTAQSPLRQIFQPFVLVVYLVFEVFLLVRGKPTATAATTPLPLPVRVQNAQEQAAPPYRVITAEEGNTMLKLDTAITLLDVRTREEFDGPKGHIKGAKLIPVQQLPKRWKELNTYPTKRVLVYCCACPRSAEAADFLVKKGFTVFKMEGGIDAWHEAKFPAETTSGKQATSGSSCSYKPRKK